MVGEGANLGFTQRGRVEAALGGRKINTDALDNSAGVDTSDHEVNIKIVDRRGDHPRRCSRAPTATRCCSRMTDEVACLVLRHNYQQSQAISVAAELAGEEHDRLERFMRALERHGRLDRAVEFLPDTAAMRTRAPEPPVSHPARALRCCWPTPRSISTTRSCDSDLPDDPLLEGELLRYFPTALQEKYEPAIRAHRLRREIAALQVVNSLVNRCGPTFVRNIGLRTGAPAAAIARAFAVVRDAWKLRDLWGDIEALDPALKAQAQIRMLVASQRFLTRAVQWTLRRLPQPLDTMAATEQLGAAVAALGDLPPSVIGEAESAALAERAAAFEAMGAPAGIARRAAALETLAAAGDLMLAARANGCSIEAAARVYFRLGERLSLARLATAAHKLPREGQWPAQAALAVQDELVDAACRSSGLGAARRRARTGAGDPDAVLARWSEPRKLALDRVDRLLKEDLAAAGTLDLAMLSVATAELRTLV